MADKKEEEKKQKYYTVEIEAMVPTKLQYRVIATSPEEALEFQAKGKGTMTSPPGQQLKLMHKIKATVLAYGSSMILLTKKY